MKCFCGSHVPDGTGVCSVCHVQTPIVKLKTNSALVVDVGKGMQNPVFIEDFRHASYLFSIGHTNVVKLGDLISIDRAGHVEIHPRGGNPLC